MSTRGVRWVVIATLGLATGCGCDEASLVGTVLAHDDGTGVLSGTVTARGAPEDRRIEIVIAPDGTGARYTVIPENVREPPTSCGNTFRYEVRNLDPGAYKVLGKIEVASGGASEYEGWFAGGASTVVVTVSGATAIPLGDGQIITDLDFELVNVLN